MSAGSSPTTTVGGGPEPVPVPKPKPVTTPPPASPIPVVVIGSPPSTVPSAGGLNDAATPAQDRQAQIAAENALLRIPYGRVSLGAEIADVLFQQSTLVLIAVWGEAGAAGIDSIEQVYLDDKLPTGQTAVLASYLGTQTTPDPVLVSAYAAAGITFADAFTGVAYSVIRLWPGTSTGMPRVSAVLKGLKVYDPRDGTQTLGTPSTYKWSDNPALCMADLESNATYGAGGSVNWASVTTAANACDDMVAGVEKRRTIGLVIDNSQTLEQWRDVMRAYAGCLCARTNGSLVLVPDRPGTSSFTFSENTGNARIKNVKRRSKRDVPTVVSIRYTDTTAIPWRDRLANAYAPGVQAGTVPWKASEVAMPGITRSTQALREAIERLNKLSLTDLTFDIEAQDEAVAVTLGDLITATAHVGLSAVAARVLTPQLPSIGRPVFSCESYDPAVYSDSVVSAPSVVDTTLPNPSTLNPPTALSIVETVYLERVNGSALAGGLIYQSRFDCSWTAPSSTFPVTYRVEVWDGTTKIRDDQVSGTVYSTPAVQQGKNYLINVFSRNTVAESATAVSGSLLAQGKLLPPGPVPRISRSTSLGGKVIFNWDPAVDIDVIRYEWRYTPNVTGGGSWASATFIDRIDGLGAVFQGLPTGTHRFYVRAIDSVGNYSTGDCTVDLQVDSDPNSFLSSKTFSSPTLTNMAAIPMLEGVWQPRWATSVTGDQFSSVEPSPLNSGANPVDSYHASGTQTWRSETWDLGTLVSGAFSITAFATALSGSFNTYIESSPDNSTYTRQPGTSWQGSGRFFKVTFEALTSATFQVDQPPKLSLAALTKSETFQVTTSASVGVLVQLANAYATLQDLQVTASEATSARIGTSSRLLLHPQTGLFLQGDITGAGGNSVLGFQPAGSYTLVSGDKLQYDVYIDPGSPAVSSFSDGGLQLVFTDTTGINTATDADGYNAIDPAVGFDALARGVWKSRSIDLTAFAGKTTGATNFVRPRFRSDSTGTHKYLLRNVRITDSTGATTRMTLWSSGDPGVSIVSSVSAANQKGGPANSFLVYCFTDAGAQVAQAVNVSFRGF